MTREKTYTIKLTDVGAEMLSAVSEHEDKPEQDVLKEMINKRFGTFFLCESVTKAERKKRTRKRKRKRVSTIPGRITKKEAKEIHDKIRKVSDELNLTLSEIAVRSKLPKWHLYKKRRKDGKPFLGEEYLTPEEALRVRGTLREAELAAKRNKLPLSYPDTRNTNAN